MPNRQPTLRIGTSGYQYNHWRNIFYPPHLPTSQWFEHYAQHFDTVEINNTFYRLPQPKTFDDWRRRAPQNFIYALKFSRYGTHLKHLKDPQGPIDLFLSRAKRLQQTLGPILVHLPPHWHVDPPRLANFLHHLPTTQRWAVELRDPSWLCDPVYNLLREHRVALCIHDLLEHHPFLPTADFLYLRFHGSRDDGNYSPQALSASAKRIAHHLNDGLDVYAYFNNDAQGYALTNARALLRYVNAR
jgi:uncharacterized protein YecE (DUF72 family)